MMRRTSTLMLGLLGLLGLLVLATPTTSGAAADPTAVSVSPSVDLVDGEGVHVVATGFSPRSQVGVVQCPAGPSYPGDCPGDPIVHTADASGAAAFDLRVTRTLPADGGRIDCADPGACVVLAYQYDNGNDRTADIAFDPTVAAPPATDTPAPTIIDIDAPDGADPTAPPLTDTTPGATYYLALGDSLVTGFAAPEGQGYVDNLLRYYRQQDPGLRLINLGCDSEVSAGLIADGLCTFGGRSQLDATEAFIASHPGQIRLITIDIGGNDVVFCGTRPAAEQLPCLNDALAVLDTNMATILGRLRAAAGRDVPLLGMNYFNPFLNHWLGTDDDKAFAHLTTGALDLVNQHLGTAFAAYQVPIADVAGAFHVDDYDTLVDSPYGMIPINVALACRWLDIGCEVGGVGSFGDDANAEGYRVIADEFTKVLPRLDGPPVAGAPPTPPPTIPAPAPPAITAPPGRPVGGVPAYTG